MNYKDYSQRLLILARAELFQHKFDIPTSVLSIFPLRHCAAPCYCLPLPAASAKLLSDAIPWSVRDSLKLSTSQARYYTETCYFRHSALWTMSIGMKNHFMNKELDLPLNTVLKLRDGRIPLSKDAKQMYMLVASTSVSFMTFLASEAIRKKNPQPQDILGAAQYLQCVPNFVDNVNAYYKEL